MNGCPRCLGAGRINYGSDTETGRLSTPCRHWPTAGGIVFIDPDETLARARVLARIQPAVKIRETAPEEEFSYLATLRSDPREAIIQIGGAVLIILIMFGLIVTAGLFTDPVADLNDRTAQVAERTVRP